MSKRAPRGLSRARRGSRKVPRLAIIMAGVTFAAALIQLPSPRQARAADPGVPFTWTPTGLPGRSEAAMAFDEATGTTVLYGGCECEHGDVPLRDTWTWDGSAWTAHTEQPRPALKLPEAAYDANKGNVVLIGVHELIENHAHVGDEVQTWTWDGVGWTLQSPAHTPPDTSYVMAYDPASENVVLFLNNPYTSVFETWTWDGSDWTQETPDHTPTSYGPMAFDAATQTIVLFASGYGDVKKTWTWDGSDWTLQSPEHSPSARLNASMVYDSDHQQIVLFGGIAASDPYETLGDTWIWDGSDWTQQNPATSPPGRQLAAMSYDSVRGEAILFGGVRAPVPEQTSTVGDWWTWDGSDWREESPGTNPSPRQGPVMAYDSAGRDVVLFGGDDGSSNVRDTWTWDGAVWTPRTPAHSPPAQDGAALAYDSERQQVVLCGGGQTWTWDGSDWTRQFPDHDCPAGANFGAMAFDAAAGRIVLFAGDSSHPAGGETWTWAGADWKQRNPDHTPPARSAATMVYDPIRQNIVLFGGTTQRPNFGDPLDDTWTWDGSDWTEQTPAHSPPARYVATMAFNPAAGTTILFGGAKSTKNYLADTWSWDGSDWTELSLPVSPTARGWGAMAFDSNDNAVLFGGFEPDPGPSSQSFAYGPKPSIIRLLGIAGGMVKTKNALTRAHPLKTSVAVGETDAGGLVSITQTRTTHRAPPRYGFLNAEAVITAPRASPGSPLTLSFRLHPSLLAGDPGAKVHVFRKESGHRTKLVKSCSSDSPPDPNPCVASRSITPSGEVDITVSTKSASVWNFGLPGFSRTLTISYRHRRHRFKGRLHSSKHACVAKQKTIVFRKRKGADKKVGKDTTSRRGVYAVHHDDQNGRYYARVLQNEERNIGICLTTKSPVLHL